MCVCGMQVATLSRLQHPHIVRYHQVRPGGGCMTGSLCFLPTFTTRLRYPFTGAIMVSS